MATRTETYVEWLERSFEGGFLREFWDHFYTVYEDKYGKETVTTSTLHEEYKNEVFDILKNGKSRMPLSDSDLYSIQKDIEGLTMDFCEASIYNQYPNIIKMLIVDDKPTAKTLLLESGLLQKEDDALLHELGPYTIEALIVHVLGMIFHNNLSSNSVIRVASLVEHMESSIRSQALFLKKRRMLLKNKFSYASWIDAYANYKEMRRSKLGAVYPIGSFLVSFLEERGLITLTSDYAGETARVVKKKGSYYLPKALYAFCNIDISLLPIKLNLPMVCQPVDWKSVCDHPQTLSDLRGGYLSEPMGEFYGRYSLLSSSNLNNFYIDLKAYPNFMSLCRIMNKLQGQPFKINSSWLHQIHDSYDLFVSCGLLQLPFLATINLDKSTNLLREHYLENYVIKKIYTFDEVLKLHLKDIQRARYERLILKLADAYDGYSFYLPAFLDFRGRIYRCGLLHFHERDLARSLILFAGTPKDAITKDSRMIIGKSFSFHYQSFKTQKDVIDWVISNIFDGPYCNKMTSELDYDLFFTKTNIKKIAEEAKRPFQYIASVYGLSFNDLSSYSTPITHDASASAYQIMSYLLLDESLAMKTNLIPSCEIQDIYSFMEGELKEYIKDKLEPSILKAVTEKLTRKIVKGIFMPIIYGKTVMSTAHDLKQYFSRAIGHKECFKVASVCFQFWKTTYPNLNCLIQLIRNMGWFSSAMDIPVFYNTPYFTTVQDYMIMKPINIWVYNRLHKKRRRVTLKVISSKRDRRQTEIATFVNFIHQKDAQIAMRVVESMLKADAPIYTVHDNFLTTALYSEHIPMNYITAFLEMGPPLLIINEFLYMNLIKPFDIEETKYTNHGFIFQNEELANLFNARMPTNLSKQQQKIWEERVKGTVAAYQNYARTVCGNPTPSYEDHIHKWHKFKDQMLIEGDLPHYCVHY